MMTFTNNIFENNAGFFFANVIFIQIFSQDTGASENWTMCGGDFSILSLFKYC
jgi:hypothetical protein